MINRDGMSLSNKLGQKLTVLQKIIIFGSLFTAIFVFIYSFIFMTPFSDLYQMDGPFLFNKLINFGYTKAYFESLQLPGEAFYYGATSGEKIGINLEYFTSFTGNELQVFNRWLFALGFFGLLVSLLPLIYFSQKRKIYYRTNLIVNTAVGGFNLYIGIHMLIQLIQNQQLVWSKDYKLLNAYQTYLKDNSATKIIDYYKQSDSNPIFIIGYIVAFLVIVFAILTILLTIFKYQYQKKQPKVDLSKVSIHE